MKKKSRLLAAVMAISMGFTGLSGCGSKEDEHSYEETIVVDVFDSLANYQGMQSGWFAKIVKEKFNMELNIIAPNVAGGGDTLYEIRSAAGDLGDLVITNGESDTIQNMVTAGLLLDMEPYLKGKQIMKYKDALEQVNEGITPKGIYVIPSELSQNSPLTPKESLEPTFGPYLRWDLYKELGYPKMQTLEDLLPVLKQMQELEPFAENGKKVYAFSFFKDWDGNLMNIAKQPCCFYGYDEFGFGLEKADGSDFQSIIDEDSLYVRSLKLLFEANQMGLVDPQSTTQKYSDFAEKYAQGQILFSPWPWAAQLQYNTLDRMEEGKGFMMADIEDMQIYSSGCNASGTRKSVIAIGSHAEAPKRLADFIDWLYSSEGISCNGVLSSAGTAGPQGLSWDYGEDGEPYLTEFGKEALLNGDAVMSEEWGGSTWADGISMLNYMPVSPCEVDDNGYPYAYQLWDSVAKLQETALDKDWKEHMGAENTREYLIQKDRLLVSPGCDYVSPAESSEISTLRSQCKAVIQKYSWEMVFADDEKEFYELLKQMQEEAISLGYDEVLAVDRANVQEYRKAKIKALEDYENDTE